VAVAPGGVQPSRRPLWVGYIGLVLLTAAMLGLLGRVYQLQTRPDPRVAALQASQMATEQLPARRGALVDRRGRVLASTRIAWRLFCDPHLIDDRSTFSEQVGFGLDYEPADVERTLSRRSTSRYIVLDERLTDERLAAFRELSLPGLYVEPVSGRDYPQGELAGQLLGFVGSDGEGLDGLERQLNDRLAGEGGTAAYLRDSRRRRLWLTGGGYQPQADGQNVQVSLDLNIQAIAQRELAAAVERVQAHAGQMIVMQPHTGEVLAMVNYPPFDPASFRHAPEESRRNRVVTDVFEPGSIFKPFVWAALTELGAADPAEMIDCTEAGWWVTPYGRTLRDAHGIGEVDWQTVLVKSSNIGMAKIAERISPGQLYDMVRRFGFGQVTQSQLPGEVEGLLNPLESWTRYSQSSIPMGQEIGVTGLQIVRALAVIANDGYFVTPTLLARDPLADGGVDDEAARQRVLGYDAARLTRQTMRRVVVEGTGRRARSDLYSIWGKTGTAQLPDFDNGGYHQDQYVSSFIGGAPTDQPRLVVACFVHRPDRRIDHYGGRVAAPAVRNVIEQSLQYLGVTPDVPDEAGPVASGGS
jgi:cell division protein FtsI (penicillin-binding protein 3)